MTNEAFIEQNVPSGKLVGIKFDLLTGNEIEKFSSINIVEGSDVTNAKLGLPNTFLQCTTCGSSGITECDGHFGCIKLPMTIYNPHLVSEIVYLLNQICPGCKSFKTILQLKRKIHSSMKKKCLMKFVKSKLFHKSPSILVPPKYMKSSINEKISKEDNETGCKYCNNTGEWYPKVRFKISLKDVQGNKGLGIVAEISKKLPRKFHDRKLTDVLPKDYWSFIPMYPNDQGTELKTISPAQAFFLLKHLHPETIKKFVPRRELMFLSCVPISPNCQRVMETSHGSDGPKLSFDGRTKAYRRVVDISRKVDVFNKVQPLGAISYITSRVLDCINMSKLHSSHKSVEDNSRKSVEDNPSRISGMKWVKNVVLSKRTDNSFRITMVGDSKIQLGEIGVPQDVCDNLYVTEHVNAHNVERLNKSCNRHLLTKEELHARIKGKLTSLRKSNQLQVGNTFYRPLENGDIVLINRPPSVHQHSLLALAVKILPIKSVVSINPLCCAPLLGDFDGDCLHGYVPQSTCSRVELTELLSLDNQLLNVQDGRSLVSLTHDSLTAAHLLTRGGVFFNKFEMQQLEMLCPCESPFQAIVRAPELESPLWTGQQLFSLLLPQSMDFTLGSSEVEIRNGEILFSSGGSFWLRNSTSGIFTTMFKCYGRKALDHLFCAQDVLCEYLTMRGLSVSLGDLYLTSDCCTRMKMIDEVSCGLKEAEVSCYTNELMLDPKMEFLLKSNDESDDISHFLNLYSFPWERTQINQSSIAAFKNIFREVQNSVLHYITRDNSLLAMIHAGSKGNLLKLVQQGVCVGLQLSTNPLPYKIPRILSCSQWNQHKAFYRHGVPEGAVDCGGQNSYALITSSFLDGLNPLELFFHALSSRANFFSEKADLPGTLTRKLMFYMRDLYVAYDGTVRSTYGQQLVQFSYDSHDEASSVEAESSRLLDGDCECNGVGGQPAGSWAACSISEAAYGALDQPVNSLEASPLLNLKKVLECGPSRTSLNRTASLFLSNKLRRLNYGLEYGALEVKHHLDRVLFSNVVTTVMIFYAADDVKGRHLSPWVSHFHLNQELLRRKRLTLQSIIAKLGVNYNSFRETSDPGLPKLHIIVRKGACSLEVEQKKYDATSCIQVAVEASDSPILLDTIKHSVIPKLLGTLIKGYMEFKRVDILCDSQPESRSQLFLKVSMSEDCLPGKFWCTLQDACIPIMDLIDWNHSHPDGVHDISKGLGIDAAWKYFVTSLKSGTADTGRTVLGKHLLMVSDSLSVTGEFHGLNARGLKQQREQLLLSSPFSQACFSQPENCFIDAAKQGSTDHLYGVIDAEAWGNEAPVGTGGPFELIYGGKVHNLTETESVYESLLSMKYNKSAADHIEICRPPGQGTANKSKGQNLVKSHSGIKRMNEYGCSFMEQTNTGFNSKSLSHGVPLWSDIVDIASSLRAILRQYPMDGNLDEADKSIVMKALMYHPKKDAKIGVGVKEIKIGRSLQHQESRCFLLIRKDGTTEDFSYRKCVLGAASLLSPKFRLKAERELFHNKSNNNPK
ncbi:DNA-directed RNA polymerase IV subunit 1 [Iris pallida]|uniref:DNA-directed RNA polymerase n=1 Tax=Iris pallida TaxID=29817 RepID=A0AAX6DQQ7_IRIPA|nr:DNA-directed RNA polymerase IV subunit 1 [Iris pallida]